MLNIPYPYQTKVETELLHNQTPVLIIAPTGSGKSFASQMPFLKSYVDINKLLMPKKMIFSTPMKILSNQFWKSTKDDPEFQPYKDIIKFSILHGDNKEDTRFEHPVTYTTIDQTLSSYLNIPYSLKASQSAVNAGAILSAYNVFDEIHLLEKDKSLLTTLAMLKQMRQFSLFTLMSATVTSVFADFLSDYLNLSIVRISDDDKSKIKSLNKTRVWHRVDNPLDSKYIYEKHENQKELHKRSIVVANTVDTAKRIYSELKEIGKNSNLSVLLVHSQFFLKDRAEKENIILREFGKNKELYTTESMILVATQVIEVGIDITSICIHTELSPTTSLIQRIGRCARYEKEKGDVYIYDLGVNDSGEKKFAPYMSDSEEMMMLWEELFSYNNQNINYDKELALINKIKNDLDTELVDQIMIQIEPRKQQIRECWASNEKGQYGRELIRDVDNINFIINDHGYLPNIDSFEVTSLFRGSFYKIFKDVYEPILDKQGKNWILRGGTIIENNNGSRTKYEWDWSDTIISSWQISKFAILMINSKNVSYSSDFGFSFGFFDDKTFSCQKIVNKKQFKSYSYETESYKQHVNRMIRVFNHSHKIQDNGEVYEYNSIQEDTAYVYNRMHKYLCKNNGLELPYKLDKLNILLYVLHDAGKLTKEWQTWARDYDADIHDYDRKDDSVFAHTEFSSTDAKHIDAAKKHFHKRPNHANEGAFLVRPFLNDFLGDDKSIVFRKPLLTAIARHHSSTSKGNTSFQEFDHYGLNELFSIFKQDGLFGNGEMIKKRFESDLSVEINYPLNEDFVDFTEKSDKDDDFESFLYFMFIRNLKLADERSLKI